VTSHPCGETVRLNRNDAPPAGVLPVQSAPESRLAKGKLLVSSEELRDPNFGESVVLLLDYNEHGAKGVIINRATHIKISELLPKVESLKQRGDTIYEGGPVARDEIMMLVRASEEPEDSRPVFRGIYLSKSAELLKRLVAESTEAKPRFRVYSGYAGWGPGQLDAEVEIGAWHIFPATAAIVFSPQPEDLWRQFIRRTTMRLADSPRSAPAGAEVRSPASISPELLRAPFQKPYPRRGPAAARPSARYRSAARGRWSVPS
jgi:putative transcriptional regulator